MVVGACSSSVPEPHMKKYSYPKGEAFVEVPKRPYKALGQVQTKVEYESMDFRHDENQLCHNYYNKAVKDLVKRAVGAGGDAVIKVQSLVFYEDGHHELFKTAECTDDGEGGEILAVGIAVKWLPEPNPSSLASPSPGVSPRPKAPVPEPTVSVEDLDDSSKPAPSAPKDSGPRAPNPADPWRPRDN
jgi:hypothetical protein